MMWAEQNIERQGTLTWCAGLPLAEERRLDRQEQEQLSQSAWRLLWQGLGAFLSITVLGVLLMVVAAELDGYWGGSMIVIAVLVAALFIFLPATLFAREGWTQRGFLLFRDLRRGYVLVFEGRLTEADLLQTEDATDLTQHRLLSLRLLTLDGTQKQTIEVLPISRRVWRVGGELVKPWVEANWKELAVAGEITKSWLHASSSLSSEGTPYRRRLSSKERTELLRETRQHWLRPFVPALLMTVWFSMLVVPAIIGGGIPRVASWWGQIHVIWITFAADAFFLKHLSQAQKMYRDVRDAEVLVESIQGKVESDAADKPPSPSVSETLPNSGRLWTEAGKPAAWRRIGR